MPCSPHVCPGNPGRRVPSEGATRGRLGRVRTHTRHTPRSKKRNEIDERDEGRGERGENTTTPTTSAVAPTPLPALPVSNPALAHTGRCIGRTEKTPRSPGLFGRCVPRVCSPRWPHEPHRKAPRKPRSYQRSGVHTLKRAVVTVGSRALPTRRTALGRALAEWRVSLVADLGGQGNVSTQQLALVDVAVRTKLMLDSVDAYVLGLDALVNRRKRCLWPVVRERQALAGQLQSVLRDLGLERRTKPLDLAAQRLLSPSELPKYFGVRPALPEPAAFRKPTTARR